MNRSVVAAVTLLATTVPATQAFAASPETQAVQANCVKTVLNLPADSLPGSSQVTTADPSGRYILGEANRDGHQHPQAVLWVDGVPRWLGTSLAGAESFGYSVIKGGLVLGTTYGSDKDEYWIYSAKTDSYRILDIPASLKFPIFHGMNAAQDIVGLSWDEAAGKHVAFVWPAGRQPRLLPTPAGATVEYLDDISDEGLIVGRVTPDGAFGATSYLWKNWNTQPTALAGLTEGDVWARDIEGTAIGGQQYASDGTTGLIWNTRNTRITPVERGVIDLNTSHDAVTEGMWGANGDYPSMIIRSDGTKITFPEGTMLTHIFNRNTQWTAAGYDVSTNTLQPIVYAC
ncbi:hypothetical protein GCM10009554_25690 [Kribbella koreensis]|uniref:Uncharacterized protein n=1 Tax=Kribbella koreensis TaxID=57909 RepID=A0ABN1Q5N9_9ACTN